jgi:hypothetical protein
MNKAALTEWATAVRPRSEVPGDRFAMAKEASAARELRLPIVVPSDTFERLG